MVSVICRRMATSVGFVWKPIFAEVCPSSGGKQYYLGNVCRNESLSPDAAIRGAYIVEEVNLFYNAGVSELAIQQEAESKIFTVPASDNCKKLLEILGINSGDL